MLYCELRSTKVTVSKSKWNKKNIPKKKTWDQISQNKIKTESSLNQHLTLNTVVQLYIR